jgi:DNA modification methylase
MERVLGGERASMAFTDPPYNVAYGDHGGQPRDARRRRIRNDALDPEAWAAFVAAWATNLLACVDGALYVCMSCREWGTVNRILRDAGGHWSTTIIWQKDRFTIGHADYQRGYEPIWYGWREGADHHWCGARDRSDVWRIDRPGTSPLHPTMKPLELVERAIEDASRPGDLVLDPFTGSGTTIIAAERTGRRCAAIELDPIHAGVAIGRWEAFTGEHAERIDTTATPIDEDRLLPATVDR